MKNKIMFSGSCTCIEEPKGHGGLEGFMLNEEYKYEHMVNVEDRSNYYRVYHHEDCYETCGVGIFEKHFKIL